MKKAKTIAIVVGAIIIGLAAVYGCYSFFIKLRAAYIISGYNTAIKQVNETAQKNGKVVLTLDGKVTTLIPVEEAQK